MIWHEAQNDENVDKFKTPHQLKIEICSFKSKIFKRILHIRLCTVTIMHLKLIVVPETHRMWIFARKQKKLEEMPKSWKLHF